jgi:ubiquinone/menaquinone biosynthesis C-methylase UbiE
MPGTAQTPDFPSRVIAGFDAAAPGYDTHGVTFFTAIAGRLIELARIRPGDRVLDAGCGAGAALIAASRATGTGGQVTGIDLSAAMLRRAAATCAALRPGNVALARADAAQPPYAAGSFDVVVASMVVFLLPDPARAARSWLGLLRPGGMLAFSWNVAEDPRWAPVIAAVDAYLPEGEGFANLLHHPPFASGVTVAAMLAAAGYTDITTTAADAEARYTGPRQWWAASWSQAPRIAWQHIAPNRQPNARDDAFRLLESVRNFDGSLTRRSLIGYTTARRPASGRDTPA